MTTTASLSAQSSASLPDASVVHVDSVASQPKTGMGYLSTESLFDTEVKDSQSTLKDTWHTIYMNTVCFKVSNEQTTVMD